MPCVLHLVRLPDEIGAGGQRRHEVVGNILHLWIDQVEATLGSRVDDGTLERVQCPLREGREGADGLDLVAEQLDADRLAAGGRVDVDDAATDCELATLLGPLDALVAGERQRLDDSVRAGSVAERNLEPVGTRLRRWELLGER